MSFLLRTTILFGLTLITNPAFADNIPTQEEMVIRKVYLPAHGFDDNDNALAVLDVVLPDPCYNLANTTVEKNDQTNEIHIHQYAWRRDDGVCAGGDLLGESSATVTASLGRLANGSYKIIYPTLGGQLLTRDFFVDKARTASIDNFNYPTVTNVAVDDIVIAPKTVSVTISGLLASACDKIADPIRVMRENDVIVIMPIAIPSNQDCSDLGSRTFHKTVDLGKLAPGGYLIHVRSLHGQAQNRLITVLKK